VYDFAIVGAGVAGSTMAWLLSESRLADRTVLLVDGARDDDELRTLSFWAAGPGPLEELVAHRWSTLRVHGGGGTHDVRVEEHSYRTLFFADLQREAKARLARRPGNRVVEGRVDELRQDGEGVTLQVGEHTFRARWVFDSRFHLRDLVVDEGRHHFLRQHFHGWIVRAGRDCFDPAVATLLDFRAGVRPGTGFFYVLPFSRREALVELVTLAPVDAEPLTRAYLSGVLGLDDVEFVDREAGVSPMTEQPFAWREGSRVRRIGVASGRLKPSTGYAFTRIVDECAGIVRALEDEGHPFAPSAGSRFYRWLDAVLLEVWDARPERIPAIFSAMFVRNPVDRVFRFLDERASTGDVARLILSLPKGPFLAAVVRRGLSARVRSSRSNRPRWLV
jgi:lycopene beta-cyclase